MAIRAHAGRKSSEEEEEEGEGQMLYMNGGGMEDDVRGLEEGRGQDEVTTHTSSAGYRTGGPQASSAGHCCERVIKSVFLHVSILSVVRLIYIFDRIIVYTL